MSEVVGDDVGVELVVAGAEVDGGDGGGDEFVAGFVEVVVAEFGDDVAGVSVEEGEAE